LRRAWLQVPVSAFVGEGEEDECADKGENEDSLSLTPSFSSPISSLISYFLPY